jgi:uncharacterized protein (DUF362 family)
MSSRSTVYVAKSGDAYEGTRKALNALGFSVKGKNVYIKPNLTCARPSCDGLTTDIGSVRAVLERLEDCPRITIGESCGDTTEAFENLGYRDLIKEFPNVELEDIRTAPIVWKSIPKPYHTREMPFNATVFEHDCVINIAKMKTHSLAGVTLCMKNIFGFIPTRKQKLMYHPFIKKAILDMNQVVRSDFCIVDGIWGNEFDEVRSTPKYSGVIVAGQNILAVDTVAASIMGIDVNDIVTYRLAFELRGRPDIDIRGTDPESVRSRYRQGCLFTTRLRYLKETTASLAYRAVNRH